MSARCPTCGHGTSGCLLTEEQWEFVIDAVDNCISNLFTYDDADREDETGVSPTDFDMMKKTQEILGKGEP